MPSFANPETIFLGLDVHRDSISVGVLHPGDRVPLTEKISADEGSVRRLVKRFDDPGLLKACYEAGPTGYDLCRLLRQMGVACEVIAPSLIPKASGDKVKNRQEGLPAPGPSAPGGRARGHPGPFAPGGSGAGPVPHPG